MTDDVESPPATAPAVAGGAVTGARVVRLTDIHKWFPGVHALDGVTLTVAGATVHGLMGENGAGKSTLMRCLFGMHRPDHGTISIHGDEVDLRTPRQALDHGISMIHQELHPVPDRNVMDNIWLGRYPTRAPLGLPIVDRKRMRADTERLIADLELELDPDAVVRRLSVSSVQMMEIAKAVSYQARVIIMDEPTSSLTEHEATHLFRVINRLRDDGVSVIYISHKIDEVLEISDEVTIMRDGRRVGTWPTAELDTDKVIGLMVGRTLAHRFPPRDHPLGEPLLEVSGLTSSDPSSFRDVSFDVRRGEVLGIGGLVGAQRTELVEALFGMRPLAAGRIVVDGRHVHVRNPSQAIGHGFALLTEERRVTGIVAGRSVYENTVLASLRRYRKALGFFATAPATIAVQQHMERLRVKTPSIATPIASLSGGNQQKVLLAKWLLTTPEILILDEPTRGVDVGAKAEIYGIINDLAASGKAIVMISSEMPELLGVPDRIAVMCLGQLTGILDRADADEEAVMRLATPSPRHEQETA